VALLSPELPFWKARTARELVITVTGKEGMLLPVFFTIVRCKCYVESVLGIPFSLIIHK
jgi:hypothetical protein